VVAGVAPLGRRRMLLLLLRLVRVLGLLLVKDVPLVLLRRVSWLLVRHGDGR